MTNVTNRRTIALAAKGGVVLVLAAATFASAIAAEPASPWSETVYTQVRLVSAVTATGTAETVPLGLHFKMEKGWKIYWRAPGDAGFPPKLKWTGSENVKDARLAWPVPERFRLLDVETIGYKDEVILPLHVVPQDAAKPVTLRLKLDYAACEKLCVPAQAQLELALTGADSTQDAAVGAAEARVPKIAEIGDRRTPAIRAARREIAAGKPRVVVDVAAPKGEAAVLFAEGPTAEWALPLPEPVAGAPAGLQRFAFELDGLPPGAKAAGATLRLTAVAGGKAIEAAFRLD